MTTRLDIWLRSSKEVSELSFRRFIQGATRHVFGYPTSTFGYGDIWKLACFGEHSGMEKQTRISTFSIITKNTMGMRFIFTFRRFYFSFLTSINVLLIIFWRIPFLLSMTLNTMQRDYWNVEGIEIVKGKIVLPDLSNWKRTRQVKAGVMEILRFIVTVNILVIHQEINWVGNLGAPKNWKIILL